MGGHRGKRFHLYGKRAHQGARGQRKIGLYRTCGRQRSVYVRAARRARHLQRAVLRQARRLLLEKLSDETDRRGYFESAVAICFPDGRTLTASGRTFGVILPEEHGENGFGYDPLFFSTEIDKCFGIASAEEKNAVSHRGRALRALAEKMRAEGIL